MYVEVDQSGKIELLSADTIIACSNNKQYSIRIPRKIKQEIYFNNKNKIKQLKYKLFCIGVYFCVERFLTKLELIVVDNEYYGKNNIIKSILMQYIRKKYAYFDEKAIKFGNIGKRSNAHYIAIETFRRNHKPNRILTKKEIFGLLG